MLSGYDERDGEAVQSERAAPCYLPDLGPRPPTSETGQFDSMKGSR